jgi:hemerythrin-like domain-containing protein
MNESVSILSLMVKDHAKLVELIDKFEEKSNEDFESMLKAFYKFEWNLEKHIFTEEKAIFTSYNPGNITEGYRMLPELTKQHNYIVNTLNNWRRAVRNKKMIASSEIYSFKDFLIRHREFEEQKVYPRLDESLDEKEKQHIIAKINEMV